MLKINYSDILFWLAVAAGACVIIALIVLVLFQGETPNLEEETARILNGDTHITSCSACKDSVCHDCTIDDLLDNIKD